ncbi:MAG: hypothetical protein GY714_01480 [Desulfobacterales bacterium]|nr:hypothetical protein [Desulfobacterales bacterium]
MRKIITLLLLTISVSTYSSEQTSSVETLISTSKLIGTCEIMVLQNSFIEKNPESKKMLQKFWETYAESKNKSYDNFLYFCNYLKEKNLK